MQVLGFIIILVMFTFSSKEKTIKKTRELLLFYLTIKKMRKVESQNELFTRLGFLLLFCFSLSLFHSLLIKLIESNSPFFFFNFCSARSRNSRSNIIYKKQRKNQPIKYYYYFLAAKKILSSNHSDVSF